MNPPPALPPQEYARQHTTRRHGLVDLLAARPELSDLRAVAAEIAAMGVAAC